MDTEIDQNLEQITREYVDFLDDMVNILNVSVIDDIYLIL